MVLFNLLPSESFNAIIYLLGGVMIGSLLPDVDASDAKVMHGYWKPIGLFFSSFHISLDGSNRARISHLVSLDWLTVWFLDASF
jgi:hypothetical protein